MTSGVFQSYPISQITVVREARQRRELKKLDELAESIHRVGLIHPIVITKDGVLVAGERRFTAIKTYLDWTSIPIQFVEDLSEDELKIIELEENIRRENITWQEEVLATREYHDRRKSMAEERGEVWAQEQTAEALGYTQQAVAQKLKVAEAIVTGDTRVASAPLFSTARGIVEREEARRKSSLKNVVDKSLQQVSFTETGEVVKEAPLEKTPPLINADFAEWQSTYSGPKFNMIHCDFPYGVGMHDSDQGAGASYGTYKDSADVYWELLKVLHLSMENVVAESAHLIFWFSMDYYQRTKELLEAMGWKVNPFPLIWMKSDGTGILPDPKRGPRRIYETAFFASRGDRVLATGKHDQGPVANAFAHPGRAKSIHMNEKPVKMIRHFMRLSVDEYSTILDPTCGSANALKAGQALGANTVLGIERDLEFYTRAVEAYFGEEDENISTL